MDQSTLETALSHLPLGPIQYYHSVTSTNDIAQQWARQGAQDRALVVADEQTAGKGRSGKTWQTPAETALAFSIILRPPSAMLSEHLSVHLSAAAGLAVVTAIKTRFPLDPQLKWPNDVHLRGKKVCGILIESDWSGDTQLANIIGIGVNISKGSVPPAEELDFPATSIEDESGEKPDRLQILAEILQAFLTWWQKTPQEVVAAWQEVLAYNGRLVQVTPEDGQPFQGWVDGIDQNGFLRVRLRSGKTIKLSSTNLSIRLVDSLPE